jgi:hypothetical protein
MAIWFSGTVNGCDTVSVLHLTASTLLFSSNDLEVRAGLFLLSARGAFLRDLAPTSALTVLPVTWRAGGLNYTLLRKLAATDKFFGKTAAVDGLRVSIYAVCNQLVVCWESKQLLEEVLGYMNVSILSDQPSALSSTY